MMVQKPVGHALQRLGQSCTAPLPLLSHTVMQVMGQEKGLAVAGEAVVVEVVAVEVEVVLGQARASGTSLERQMSARHISCLKSVVSQ